MCVYVGHSIIVYLPIKKCGTELSILNAVVVGIKETFFHLRGIFNVHFYEGIFDVHFYENS